MEAVTWWILQYVDIVVFVITTTDVVINVTIAKIIVILKKIPLSLER